jgi:hypothetical protein
MKHTPEAVSHSLTIQIEQCSTDGTLSSFPNAQGQLSI